MPEPFGNKHSTKHIKEREKGEGEDRNIEANPVTIVSSWLRIASREFKEIYWPEKHMKNAETIM